MMVFVPAEFMAELGESDQPATALSSWLNRQLGVPVRREGGEVVVSRGRLTLHDVGVDEVRILWHEVH